MNEANARLPAEPERTAVAAGARHESLVTYPCDFPVKVMGLNVPALVPAMLALAQEFDVDFTPEKLELRESSSGKYLGITLNIQANSREQLDALYMRLTQHPMVKLAL